ncbi:MAG: hypothetical protein KGD64_14905 [Candidatus Heimdallarchaeota archaeon]|nr:hypothetical protein [Candidatus Heimdallarchaeota archaeon]
MDVTWGTNPFVADSTADPDNDGLTNEEEQFYETDPTNSDSDGDGLDDGMEVDLGYDPTDPYSNPGGGGGFFFP